MYAVRSPGSPAVHLTVPGATGQRTLCGLAHEDPTQLRHFRSGWCSACAASAATSGVEIVRVGPTTFVNLARFVGSDTGGTRQHRRPYPGRASGPVVLGVLPG